MRGSVVESWSIRGYRFKLGAIQGRSGNDLVRCRPSGEIGGGLGTRINERLVGRAQVCACAMG